LLAGLYDDSRGLKLNKGVVSAALLLGHVDDQSGRLEVVHEVVDLVPQLEDAACVATHSGVGELSVSATES
jgi:hypothetical protein